MLRAALGTGPTLRVFGEDYATADGTCVRDYVHVDDLAQAHELALHYLRREPGAHAFNLGIGHGFSVREVIAAAQRVTSRRIAFEVAPRRDGDPAVLVAASERARRDLRWTPAFTTLDPIIASAWRWHQAPAY